MNHFLEIALLYLLLYFVLSGVDELSIDLRLAYQHWRRKGRTPELPEPAALRRRPESLIAILVPLWQESGVVRSMVERNLADLEYSNYQFFLGVYPNDEATIQVVSELVAAHPQVHMVTCSRPGPTSKADCLNHLYRALEFQERQSGCSYSLVVLHDAEDVLHPASLALMNWFAADFGMVQVPVLPFPTPLSQWVHGVYCDEFAEFLSRDMLVRNREGAFLPSNGVGTAFRREYLDQLRESQSGVLFDDECLTEDYEIGLKLADMGCPQLFLPISTAYGDLLATREFFPRSLATAIRQRTRWISGQCLQSWEKHGWPLRPKLSYWFWRDRKGLWGNFLSFLAMLLLVLSAAAWTAPEFTGLGPWLWITGSVPAADLLYPLCTALTVQRMLLRMVLVGRIYGMRFALGVPPRMLLSAWINVRATAAAIQRFAVARWQRKRLGWLKTEHAFPIAVPVRVDMPVAVERQGVAEAQMRMAAAVGQGGPGMSSSVRHHPPAPVEPPTLAAPPMNEAAEVAGEAPGGIEAAPSRIAPKRVRSVLQPLLLRDDEVVVMIPSGLSPMERRMLTRRTHAKLVFVEEHEAQAMLGDDREQDDGPIAQAGD